MNASGFHTFWGAMIINMVRPCMDGWLSISASSFRSAIKRCRTHDIWSNSLLHRQIEPVDTENYDGQCSCTTKPIVREYNSGSPFNQLRTACYLPWATVWMNLWVSQTKAGMTQWIVYKKVAPTAMLVTISWTGKVALLVPHNNTTIKTV